MLPRVVLQGLLPASGCPGTSEPRPRTPAQDESRPRGLLRPVLIRPLQSRPRSMPRSSHSKKQRVHVPRVQVSSAWSFLLERSMTCTASSPRPRRSKPMPRSDWTSFRPDAPMPAAIRAANRSRQTRTRTHRSPTTIGLFPQTGRLPRPHAEPFCGLLGCHERTAKLPVETRPPAARHEPAWRQPARTAAPTTPLPIRRRSRHETLRKTSSNYKEAASRRLPLLCAVPAVASPVGGVSHRSTNLRETQPCCPVVSHSLCVNPLRGTTYQGPTQRVPSLSRQTGTKYTTVGPIVVAETPTTETKQLRLSPVTETISHAARSLLENRHVHPDSGAPLPSRWVSSRDSPLSFVISPKHPSTLSFVHEYTSPIVAPRWSALSALSLRLTAT